MDIDAHIQTFKVMYSLLVVHSWFVDLMRYIVRLLPDKSVRQTFVTKLISSWQDYLTILFDDGESSNDSGKLVRCYYYLDITRLVSTMLLHT